MEEKSIYWSEECKDIKRQYRLRFTVNDRKLQNLGKEGALEAMNLRLKSTCIWSGRNILDNDIKHAILNEKWEWKKREGSRRNLKKLKRSAKKLRSKFLRIQCRTKQLRIQVKSVICWCRKWQCWGGKNRWASTHPAFHLVAVYSVPQCWFWDVELIWVCFNRRTWEISSKAAAKLSDPLFWRNFRWFLSDTLKYKSSSSKYSSSRYSSSSFHKNVL